MSEDGPTNAALAVMLDGLNDQFQLFRTDNKEAHDAILEKVTMTNGRVTKLEQAKWMLYGGWVVVTVILVPLAVAYFVNHLRTG